MTTFVLRLMAQRPNFAQNMTDAVVTTGTARFEVGRMLAGFVRPRADA